MPPLTGKIASLPLQIRCQVSKRIRNKELPGAIAQWLNEEFCVLEILEAKFDDAPITEADIEEWKNGGFLEWISNTDFSEHAYVMAENAADMRAAGLTTDDLFMNVLAFHAQFIRGLDIVPHEVASRRMDLIERLTKNVLSLRKSELAESRREIELGRLELARERGRNKSGSSSSSSSPALSFPESPASLCDSQPSATPALKSSTSDQSTDQPSTPPVEAAPRAAVHPVHAPAPPSQPVSRKPEPPTKVAAPSSDSQPSTAGAAILSACSIPADAAFHEPGAAPVPSARPTVPSTASPRNKFGLL